MANKQKAEIKIGVWQEEIEELNKELTRLNSQIDQWNGAKQAYTEGLQIINSLLQEVKQSMDWYSLPKKEQEKKIKAGEKEPMAKFDDVTGFEAAKLMRPAQTMLDRKMQNANRQPGEYQAQKGLVLKQIDRLNRLIANEQTKDFSEFSRDPKEDTEE